LRCKIRRIDARPDRGATPGTTIIPRENIDFLFSTRRITRHHCNA